MPLVRADFTKYQDRVATLDTDVARLEVENLKLKDEVRKVNVDDEEARSSFIRNQGSLIEALSYKIF